MSGHKERVLCTLEWQRLTEHACEWERTTGDRYIFTNIYAHGEPERARGGGMKDQGKDPKTKERERRKMQKRQKREGWRMAAEGERPSGRKALMAKSELKEGGRHAVIMTDPIWECYYRPGGSGCGNATGLTEPEPADFHFDHGLPLIPVKRERACSKYRFPGCDGGIKHLPMKPPEKLNETVQHKKVRTLILSMQLRNGQHLCPLCPSKNSIFSLFPIC